MKYEGTNIDPKVKQMNLGIFAAGKMFTIWLQLS